MENFCGLRAKICKPKLDYWVTEIKKHQFFFPGLVPETKSPHDLSNGYWPELSSPYTESSDENGAETTTHVHEPFFEENSTQINVTTQLGSDVYLHCRVNDLREKMVSRALNGIANPTKTSSNFYVCLIQCLKMRKVFDVPRTPQSLFNISNTLCESLV